MLLLVLAEGVQPLLIHAESGTGKELLARHIHRQSARGGLFVAVNCGALSKAHGAAELFGQAAHLVGRSSRAGWLGSAQGGTLYLDEVADLAVARYMFQRPVSWQLVLQVLSFFAPDAHCGRRPETVEQFSKASLRLDVSQVQRGACGVDSLHLVFLSYI